MYFICYFLKHFTWAVPTWNIFHKNLRFWVIIRWISTKIYINYETTFIIIPRSNYYDIVKGDTSPTVPFIWLITTPTKAVLIYTLSRIIMLICILYTNIIHKKMPSLHQPSCRSCTDEFVNKNLGSAMINSLKWK